MKNEVEGQHKQGKHSIISCRDIQLPGDYTRKSSPKPSNQNG